MSHPHIHFDAFDAELQLADVSRAFDAAFIGVQDIPERDKNFLDAVLNGMESPDREDARTFLENESWNETGRAIDSLCAAFFLAGYAILEYAVVRIIDNFFVESESRLRAKDLAGNAFDRFSIVTEKIARTKPTDEVCWADRKILQELRNFLAHNNGIAFNQDENSKLDRFVASLPGTRVVLVGDSGARRIVVEPQFVRDTHSGFVRKIRSAQSTLTEALKCSP